MGPAEVFGGLRGQHVPRLVVTTPAAGRPEAASDPKADGAAGVLGGVCQYFIPRARHRLILILGHWPGRPSL